MYKHDFHFLYREYHVRGRLKKMIKFSFSDEEYGILVIYFQVSIHGQRSCCVFHRTTLSHIGILINITRSVNRPRKALVRISYSTVQWCNISPMYRLTVASIPLNVLFEVGTHWLIISINSQKSIHGIKEC